MSRHRPAAAPRSPYITRDGWEALQREQDGLWKKRRSVVQHLAAAAAEGDRSENAEYIYRKKQLRELDRRIRYLQKRLPDLKVVNDPPADHGRIFFGATVTLEDAAGVQTEYRIVGADEFDPARGWISIDSPLSIALLGKCADEDIQVETPAGVVSYYIVAIHY